MAWGEWRERLASLFRRAARRGGALGREGERAAERHLEGLGYHILERNYRVRGGEADLVAAKDGLVVVIEVKARNSRAFGAPADAVTPRKARRVLRAGRIFCRARGLSVSKLRADVVAVEREGAGFTLRHYPNALSDPAPRRRR